MGTEGDTFSVLPGTPGSIVAALLVHRRRSRIPCLRRAVCRVPRRLARRCLQVTDLEALCTLDAGRFRLPLAQAVARLLQGLPHGTVLIWLILSRIKCKVPRLVA